ncbi:MAG TPA: 4Fe-4S dicluster domain-containing protein [Gemmatimonadales bacterium]|nr:4Fe-4S dicluster domain-containing protein [Gemmatimonadales bacterium]
MRREAQASQAVFDLPARKWFIPDGKFDFSAIHFSRRAATPVGPAAGPHTQLAQNIVLAWLAGSRIIELKTVQVNDRLEIPRPCIHVPNIGYNVEWSQELRVEESTKEYAKAVFLIEILKATRAFGLFPDAPTTTAALDTVYDISVGYDLEGIRSDKVNGFLQALKQPAALFDECRGELAGEFPEYRNLPLPESISDCVTLSTFHGCPADQIEAIGRHLLEECGLHTIIKLNPTLLGYERVHELLIERLGYRHLELRGDAFDHDLQYDDGLAILRNLRDVAERRGSTIGAKFTNTMVVANKAEVFPTQADPYMYVSGPPLHVIAMTLMQRFRDDLGFEFPVSFSAGVDAKNFPTAVACGMVPVTTCTDLLRQGGYGRLPAYLRALGREMERVGVTSREAFVLAARGRGAEATKAALELVSVDAGLWHREGTGLAKTAVEHPDDLPRALRALAPAQGLVPDELVLLATRLAGRLNGTDIVPLVPSDSRYHADANAKPPRTIDSRLDLYDCINCDLCIAACPNDAIFAYESTPVATDTVRLETDGAGGLRRMPGRGFAMNEAHQLAVIEGACNECSNCEVYCPEVGAPFVVKERLFLTHDDFDRAHHLDGFVREGDVLLARLDGRNLRLRQNHAANRGTVTGEGIDLELSLDPFEVTGGTVSDDGGIDTALLWRMKTVWDSIYHAAAPNMLNSMRYADE